MWIVDVTSTARVLRLQGSVTNAKVKNPTEFKPPFLYPLASTKPLSTIFFFSSSDWTTGPHCEHCKPGSFGSALAGGEGCIPCQCNGHGDALQGFCHNQTGQCYCTHHTQGPHCESCLPGYYGDPRWVSHLGWALIICWGRCHQMWGLMKMWCKPSHSPMKNYNFVIHYPLSCCSKDTGFIKTWEMSVPPFESLSPQNFYTSKST